MLGRRSAVPRGRPSHRAQKEQRAASRRRCIVGSVVAAVVTCQVVWLYAVVQGKTFGEVLFSSGSEASADAEDYVPFGRYREHNRLLQIPEFVTGDSGLPVDTETTECDGLPPEEWEPNAAAPGGHPGSQGGYGIPELVTRCTVQPVGGFRMRDEVDMQMWRREDATVAARFAALEDAADPRVAVVGHIHLDGEEVWAEKWQTLEKNIALSLTIPEHHHYWSYYVEYPRYDIRDCPVTTPECLAWLSPGLRGGRRATAATTLSYRKCCVEHRRLRDLLWWTLGVLEQRLPPLVGRYALTYGMLIAMIRDGGAMSAADTDVDMHVVQQYGAQIQDALNREPWSPDVGAVYLVEGNKLMVGWTTEGPPDKDGKLVTRTREERQDHPPTNFFPETLVDHTHGDSHVELYVKDAQYKAKPIWNSTLADAIRRNDGNEAEMVLFKQGHKVLDPLRPCLLWNRVVTCPAKSNLLLRREYDGDKWYTPLRTPRVHGLFGLSWCGDAGETCWLERGSDGALHFSARRITEMP